jgi:puromycin-sensitive aminopeptidase
MAWGLGLQDLVPSEVVQFEEDEILVIGFDRELPAGEGVLTMEFTGTLNDRMRGFYRRYALCLFY